MMASLVGSKRLKEDFEDDLAQIRVEMIWSQLLSSSVAPVIIACVHIAGCCSARFVSTRKPRRWTTGGCGGAFYRLLVVTALLLNRWYAQKPLPYVQEFSKNTQDVLSQNPTEVVYYLKVTLQHLITAAHRGQEPLMSYRLNKKGQPAVQTLLKVAAGLSHSGGLPAGMSLIYHVLCTATLSAVASHV